MFIWDNTAFTNWQNGQVSWNPVGRTLSFYDSGFTTDGTIDSAFFSGTYCGLFIYKNNSTLPVNMTSDAYFWYIPN